MPLLRMFNNLSLNLGRLLKSMEVGAFRKDEKTLLVDEAYYTSNDFLMILNVLLGGPSTSMMSYNMCHLFTQS